MKFLTKYPLFVGMLAAVFLSCKPFKDMKWTFIDFNQTEGETPYNKYFDAISKYNFKQILALNSDTIFIVGETKEPHNNKDGILYFSFDGGKKMQRKMIQGQPLSQVASVKDSLFFLSGNMQNGVYKTAILRSDRSASQLEIVKEFDSTLIENIKFYSPSVAVAFFTTNNEVGNSKLEAGYTRDAGHSWTTLPIENPMMLWDGFEFEGETAIKFIKNNSVQLFHFDSGLLSKADHINTPNYFTATGYYIDPVSREAYTYARNQETEDVRLIFLNDSASRELPKGLQSVSVSGDYMQGIIYEKPYATYCWSEDKGQTWHQQVLTDFFIDADPIGYYGKGYVYLFATLFKGKEQERGIRFAIKTP